ncbi:MAG: leucyl aminopeptidase family protein [Pseudomonadota bacterium]
MTDGADPVSPTDHGGSTDGASPDDAAACAEARARATFATDASAAFPLILARANALDEDLAQAPQSARAWAQAVGFDGSTGRFLFAPDSAGGVAAGLFGVGTEDAVAALEPPKEADGRDFTLAGAPVDEEDAALAWALGAYRFDRYKSRSAAARLAPGSEAAREAALAKAIGVYLTRDLVNTPTSDLGPAALEAAARSLAARHGGAAETIVGAALLERNYPMIHAVGRAAAEAPRLIDLRFGSEDLPKVTLVGKGVCFDTGGLDIKPARAMRLMKKDMGGAATALGLADMILRAGLPVRLRVLIPAVENAISADSFRPGDVLTSRKGITVEVGDTDAEGRLVLADAIADADAEAPELLIDFATLTGAARVAVGPDLAPFFTDDERLAADLEAASVFARDPVWRLPLWDGYEADLSSKVADVCSVSATGFAGSTTAALFLRRFVEKAASWVHFDIYAWRPKARPGHPEGGACQAALATLEFLKGRYSPGSGRE